MGLPAVQEARPFYRAGKQRFEDARLLLEKAERTTGAIYLAGYGVMWGLGRATSLATR